VWLFSGRPCSPGGGSAQRVDHLCEVASVVILHGEIADPVLLASLDQDVGDMPWGSAQYAWHGE